VSSPGGIDEFNETVWTCPTIWLDRRDGTHALVPWETWERYCIPEGAEGCLLEIMQSKLSEAADEIGNLVTMNKRLQAALEDLRRIARRALMETTDEEAK